MAKKTFKPGDKVKWTKEAVDGVDPRDMYDAALVIEGMVYEVVKMSKDGEHAYIARPDQETSIPANPNCLELAS